MLNTMWCYCCFIYDKALKQTFVLCVCGGGGGGERGGGGGGAGGGGGL